MIIAIHGLYRNTFNSGIQLPGEFIYNVDAIKLKIQGGSAGGEISPLVGDYLKLLRRKAPAFILLKPQIDFVSLNLDL